MDVGAVAEVLRQPDRAEHRSGGVVALRRVAAVAAGPQFAHRVLARAGRLRARDVAALAPGRAAREVASLERREHAAAVLLRDLELAFVEAHRLQLAVRPFSA